MAVENPVDGYVIKKQVTATLKGHSTVQDSKNSKQDSSENKEDGTKTVPYYKLFSFADTLDYMLMSVGTISAIGNGLCTPLMTVIFGEVINSFGRTGNTKEVVDAVSKVKLWRSHVRARSGGRHSPRRKTQPQRRFSPSPPRKPSPSAQWRIYIGTWTVGPVGDLESSLEIFRGPLVLEGEGMCKLSGSVFTEETIAQRRRECSFF